MQGLGAGCFTPLRMETNDMTSASLGVASSPRRRNQSSGAILPMGSILLAAAQAALSSGLRLAAHSMTNPWARWETALQYCQVVHGDHRLVATVSGVKVRRAVVVIVVIVDADHDAIEAADLRHPLAPGGIPA